MAPAFLVRLASEPLMGGLQAADWAGFLLFASISKKRSPIISCFTLGRVDLRPTSKT